MLNCLASLLNSSLIGLSIKSHKLVYSAISLNKAIKFLIFIIRPKSTTDIFPVGLLCQSTRPYGLLPAMTAPSCFKLVCLYDNDDHCIFDLQMDIPKKFRQRPNRLLITNVTQSSGSRIFITKCFP